MADVDELLDRQRFGGGRRLRGDVDEPDRERQTHENEKAFHMGSISDTVNPTFRTHRGFFGTLLQKLPASGRMPLIESVRLRTQADLIEWLRDRPDDATTRSTFAEEERMNRLLGVVVVLTVVCLAAPASAQVQTGSILVRATDQQGAMMPGVSITISSPVLISGTMTAAT